MVYKYLVPPPKWKFLPILAKNPLKIEIKLFPQCAIPHENQSQPQIPREWLQHARGIFFPTPCLTSPATSFPPGWRRSPLPWFENRKKAWFCKRSALILEKCYLFVCIYRLNSHLKYSFLSILEKKHAFISFFFCASTESCKHFTIVFHLPLE